MKKRLNFLLFMFLSIVLYAKSYSIFYLNNLCGVIDKNRKIIVEPKYEDIRISKDDYFVCLKVGKGTDFYDTEGTKILEYSINHFTRKYSDYEWLSYIPDSGNKYIKLNIKTKKETEFINEHYSKENLPNFINNVSPIIVFGEKNRKYEYRIQNINGKVLASDIRQTDCSYSEGLIPVVFYNNKSGFLNIKGKMVIDVPLYEDYRMGGLRISPFLNYTFSEGVVFIQTEKDKWFLINKKGYKTELPKEFKFITRKYSNGLTVVKNQENKFGYVNKKFELVIPCNFESANGFEGKYAAVKYDGKDAIVDKTGNIYFCDELKM